MDLVVIIALILGALNIGFHAGRVFERWEWVARQRRERKHGRE